MKLLKLIKEIYIDRALLIELSKKDLARKFSGTYLGIMWSFMQPFLNILVYWLVFQYAFRSEDIGNIPYILWFICGIIPWLFFSEAFSSASNSFLEYNYLIKKVKFNINILPLVKIISSFFIHVVFCIFAILICSVQGFFPTIYIFQIVYYVAAMIVLLFALSLITSSIMVFFRDLNQIISIILLLGMWGSPIAWNLSNFSKNIQTLLMLNPFCYIIEGYRDCILGRCWFWEKSIWSLYFWILTLVFLVIGTFVYTKLKPHFADVV